MDRMPIWTNGKHVSNEHEWEILNWKHQDIQITISLAFKKKYINVSNNWINTKTLIEKWRYICTEHPPPSRKVVGYIPQSPSSQFPNLRQCSLIRAVGIAGLCMSASIILHSKTNVLNKYRLKVGNIHIFKMVDYNYTIMQWRPTLKNEAIRRNFPGRNVQIIEGKCKRGSEATEPGAFEFFRIKIGRS